MEYSLPKRAVLLAAALAGAGPACAASLDITGAWLRQPPPGQTGAAIYMVAQRRRRRSLVGARVEPRPAAIRPAMPMA
jgi:copper(I)-binding protein